MLDITESLIHWSWPLKRIPSEIFIVRMFHYLVSYKCLDPIPAEHIISASERLSLSVPRIMIGWLVYWRFLIPQVPGLLQWTFAIFKLAHSHETEWFHLRHHEGKHGRWSAYGQMLSIWGTWGKSFLRRHLIPIQSHHSKLTDPLFGDPFYFTAKCSKMWWPYMCSHDDLLLRLLVYSLVHILYTYFMPTGTHTVHLLVHILYAYWYTYCTPTVHQWVLLTIYC